MNVVVSKQEFMRVLRCIQVCQHGRCGRVTPVSILPLPKLQKLPVGRSVVLGPDLRSLPPSRQWEDDPCPAEQTGCMLLPLPHKILIGDVARVIFTPIVKAAWSALLSLKRSARSHPLFWGNAEGAPFAVEAGASHRCIRLRSA